MLRKTARTARKRHRCGSCGAPIAPGDRHWEHVAVDTDYVDGWQRMRECGDCATRHNRPVPEASRG